MLQVSLELGLDEEFMWPFVLKENADSLSDITSSGLLELDDGLVLN